MFVSCRKSMIWLASSPKDELFMTYFSDLRIMLERLNANKLVSKSVTTLSSAHSEAPVLESHAM